MIRRIFRLGTNEIRLTFKDRSNAFWMFVMPIIFIMFFGNIMGTGQNDPSDIPPGIKSMASKHRNKLSADFEFVFSI